MKLKLMALLILFLAKNSFSETVKEINSGSGGDWSVDIVDLYDNYLIKSKDSDIVRNFTGSNVSSFGARYGSDSDKIVTFSDEIKSITYFIENTSNRGGTGGFGGGVFQLDASNTDVNINTKHTNTASGFDIYKPNQGEIYGVTSGSGVSQGIKDDSPEFSYKKYATTTIKNLNINSKIEGDNSIFGVLNTGIRSIQGAYLNSGNGPAGRVIINGNTVINLDGGRQEAIYISGQKTNNAGIAEDDAKKATVILMGDTYISLKNSKAADSSAIKIGKNRQTGMGAGYLESHGNLDIDMTDSGTSSAAIKLTMHGSEIKADYDTSSTKVRTKNGNVLSIGYNDWGTDAQAKGGIKAFFKDADFLILDKNGSDDLISIKKGNVNSVLSFIGDKTLLDHSIRDGYIINVENESNADVYLKDHGKMIGLVNKGNNSSSLNLYMSNGFEWILSKSQTEKDEGIATLTKVILKDNAKLSAYDSDFIINGDVNNYDLSVIDLVGNNDLSDETKLTTLTINGDYIGD
ncbi:TPA: hypothetical protein ACOA1Y_003642, partial [Vibrio cholerae]